MSCLLMRKPTNGVSLRTDKELTKADQLHISDVRLGVDVSHLVSIGPGVMERQRYLKGLLVQHA